MTYSKGPQVGVEPPYCSIVRTGPCTWGALSAPSPCQPTLNVERRSDPEPDLWADSTEEELELSTSIFCKSVKRWMQQSGSLGVHCRLIKFKNAWGSRFFSTVMVSNDEVRHSLFPQGSQCIPPSSLMTKQKVELVAVSVQTISAHPKKKTLRLSLCVWTMWEPSFLSC